MTHMMCFWLSHTNTNTNFFPKPPTTFLTCFSRGEKRKNAGKKFRLNQESNSQPPGHESDTLTTEPPGRGLSSWIRRTRYCRKFSDCATKMSLPVWTSLKIVYVVVLTLYKTTKCWTYRN